MEIETYQALVPKDSVSTLHVRTWEEVIGYGQEVEMHGIGNHDRIKKAVIDYCVKEGHQDSLPLVGRRVDSLEEGATHLIFHDKARKKEPRIWGVKDRGAPIRRDDVTFLVAVNVELEFSCTLKELDGTPIKA